MSADEHFPVSTGAASAVNLFRLEGEYWTISYEAVVCRLRDSKGLRYLVHLLRHPGHRFSSAELLDRVRTGETVSADGEADAADDPAGAERARSAVGKRIRAALAKINAHHPALGRHLEDAVKTGHFCAYRPCEPIAWSF